MAMIWATAAEVRAFFAEQLAAGDTSWSGLPETDAAVDTLITNAGRALVPKVIRWPILDDSDRAEDVEQRAHLVVAVCEVIHARLVAQAAAAAEAEQLGALAGVVSGGGRVRAGNLEVQGGNRGSASRSRSTLPIAAVDALAAAGLIGGSVPTW